MCACCMTIRPKFSRQPAKTKMVNPEKPNKQTAERHPDRGGQLATDGRTATMAHRSVNRATGELVKTYDDMSDAESLAVLASARLF